jgi:hypothetical protein
MRLIASFRGKNREFRAWLAAGMPANVVFLAEYKKSRPKRGGHRKYNLDPSIA